MINLKLSKTLLALLVLPIAALLNDALTYKLGSIFLTPYKLALILSTILLFQPFLLIFSKKKFIYSNITIYFVCYCLLLICSIFYSSNLAISQKVNYFLFITCEIIIIIGLSNKLKYVDINRLIESFIRVIIGIFFLSLILSTAQLIFSDQLIYTGLFASRKITYAITGFNIERLFLCEFLIIGLAMIMFKKKYLKSIRLILLIWVGFLILYSGSFTGTLGFLGLVLLLIRSFKLKSSLYYLVILIPFVYLVSTNLELSLERKATSNEKKFESYFLNASEENWRLVSSIALLDDVVSNPTFLGHGYLSSSRFLKDTFYYYSRDKYGEDNATDKANTSHTFVSVIYDQGILGFILIIIFVFKLLKLILKLYRNNKHSHDTYYNLILKVTYVLSILVLLRFSFYYHTINHWHYLVLIVFTNLTVLKKNNILSTQ